MTLPNDGSYYDATTLARHFRRPLLWYHFVDSVHQRVVAAALRYR